MKITALLLTMASLTLVDNKDTPSPLADIGPAPAVKLIDAEGQPFDLATLRGKVVIVSFVFTTCNGTCPLTSATLAKVRDTLESESLWAKNVEFVSISLDPSHDTPKALKLYAGIYAADPKSWHFLTGTIPEVDRVVASWGMWSKKNDMGVIDHPSRIFLVDPKGREREIYNLETITPTVVLGDVRGLLAESR